MSGHLRAPGRGAPHALRGSSRSARLLLAALAAAAPLARAQEATVTADVDARKVGVEDQVQLTVTVSGASVDLPEEPRLPPLGNLRAVAGPFVSTQFSWVNGRASQAKSFTWTLAPQGAGPAEIGAVRVTLASGEKTTAPIAVEVVPGSVKPRRPARPMSPFDPFGGEDPFEDFFGRRARGPQREPKLRAEVRASRTRVHVGEPVLVTYFVDTTVSLADVQFKEPPQYPGFWAEELDRSEGPPGGQPVTIDGQPYRRFALLRRLLFPTRAGALSIPSSTLRLGLARRSFFDPAGGGVERSTQPLTITAEPLPGGPDFSGAVGQFKATATLDRDALAFGEAATLRFELEGSGNLKWVERGPEVTVPGAKVYPPQVKSALKAGVNGISGAKTWEYVVVPETAGTLEIPALPFSYFDPAAGRLEELRTRPLSLRVGAATAGAAPTAGGAAAPGAAARSTAGLALRSDLDPARRSVPRLSARTLAVLLGLTLAAHGALAAGVRVAERRRRAAGRPATSRGVRQALHDLRRAGRGGLTKEAAAALIEKALHEAFGPIQDGAGPPAGERERAARAVLQDVQFVRYAPQLGDYSEKIREAAARAEEVVRRWA